MFHMVAQTHKHLIPVYACIMSPIHFKSPRLFLFGTIFTLHSLLKYLRFVSVRLTSKPAQKMCPLHRVIGRASVSPPQAPPPLPMTYRCLKSGYTMRLGKPLRQIRIPSSTPLQVSWCITKWESITPGERRSGRTWSHTRQQSCGSITRGQLSVVSRKIMNTPFN